VRDVATLALAAGTIATLVSGLFVGVTLVGGPPTFLWAFFLASAATTALSLLVYAYLAAGDRSSD
jgi:hypothetical protein